jgi:two-component system sensor histidine kinase YesM
MAGRINLRQYFSRYHSNSIFFRNLALILLLVAVPLIVLSLFTYGYNKKILDEEIQKANTRSLLKFQGSMDIIQNEVERITAQIVKNENVLRFANTNLKVYPDYKQIEILRNIMHDMNLMIHNYIFSVYVYSDSNKYLLTPSGGGHIDKWNDLSVHNRVGTDVDAWYYDYQYEDRPVLEGTYPEKFLTYYKMIFRAGGTERMGITAILLDIVRIKSFLFGQDSNEGEIMFVVDNNRQILFSTELSWINQPLKDLFTSPKENLFDQGGIQPVQYDEQPYIFSFIRSDVNDWIYCSILSREEFYYKQDVLRQIMVISLILSLAISIITAFLISLYVFKPIHEVIGMLEDPAEISNYKIQDNELKFIAGNIMHNYDEFQHSKDEIQNRASMLNTARVRALQAQINPHFLNNTLQLVNWTIMKETGNEDSEAIEILENLADLVRVNMETKNNLTSLREEADYAARYMAIQKKRYGNRIRYEENIPGELYEIPVLKMLLQPLVENAIYHGLKKSQDAGIIRFKASRVEDSLILQIEDNGVGMDISEITSLNETLISADSLTDRHIGLINVSLRLRLVFGRQSAITLSSCQPRGIRVTVSMPIQG